jgi:ankyrin repeat protein
LIKINLNLLNLTKLNFYKKYIPIIKNVNNSALIFLIILLLFFYPFFLTKAQDQFEVITEEKSDANFNLNPSKSIAKISKTKKASSDSTEKNTKTITENSANKTTTLDQQNEEKHQKNIYDLSNDDVAGINVLMMAVSNNDIQGVKFYAKAGLALINQKNYGGATALHIASREGFYEVAKILVDLGADVNAIDNEGWTPLMRANLNNNFNIVELLVNKGANSGGLNNANESVIMHATLANCDKCLNLMLEKLNFSKYLGNKILKEQITDSFIISRNRENAVIQGLLESYLDRLIKITPIIELNQDNQESQKKIPVIPANNEQTKAIKELINKDQQQVEKVQQDKIQAKMMADFIDQKNTKTDYQKKSANIELEKKFKLININERTNDQKIINQNNKIIQSIDGNFNKGKFKLVNPTNSSQIEKSDQLTKNYILKKINNYNQGLSKNNNIKQSPINSSNSPKMLNKNDSISSNSINYPKSKNPVKKEENISKSIIIDQEAKANKSKINSSVEKNNPISNKNNSSSDSKFEIKNIDESGKTIDKKPKYVIGKI